jgi:hypothetical protein
MTSDSRGGGVGVISGASTWLSEGTPPGAKYGSSRNHQYINLRPNTDTADGPSTTTYTFERPTPPGGWAFALGDIDADEVTISATDAEGQPISVEDFGFQGVFNYCDADAGPSCDGNGVVPDWDPDTGTLSDPTGDADTHGATGWFEPTAPIKTLTFTFRWKSGFPVYQTWFMNLTRDISGAVSGQAECVSGTTIRLLGPDGTELDSTTPNDDGSYEFLGYTASDGYEVEVAPPSGCGIDAAAGESGHLVRPVDLRTSDASGIDFVVQQIRSATLEPDETLPNTGATTPRDGRVDDTVVAVAALIAVIAGLGFASLRRR